MLISEAISERRSEQNPSESPSFDVITEVFTLKDAYIFFYYDQSDWLVFLHNFKQDQGPTTITKAKPISVAFPSLTPPSEPHSDALKEAERIIVSKAIPVVLEKNTHMCH